MRYANRPLFHALEEFARQGEVDVRFQEDAPHFAQAFLDIGFGEDTTPAEARERGLEFLGEFVKHSLKS